MDNSELKHWGIKGMKWGVRKAQNNLTAATVSGASKKEIKKALKKVDSAEKKLARALTKGRTLYRNRRRLSMSEIEDGIKTMSMHGKTKQITISEELFGKEFVDRVLNRHTS